MSVAYFHSSTTVLESSKRVIINILATQNFIAERLNEILKPFEISAEQFNVLRILRGQKGKPCNMFLIQERMISKTSNTTRLVDKLLIKNLVTRNVCPANRRKIEVLITSKGLALLTILDPKIIEFENSLADNLSGSDLDLLINLLEKYRNEIPKNIENEHNN